MFLIDGTSNTDPNFNTFVISPNIDSPASGSKRLDWKAQAKSFEEMVAYGYFQQTLATWICGRTWHDTITA